MQVFGLKNVTVLHTKDRVRADADEFVEPLRCARGVWIDGGRQYRLVNAYLETAVEREIKALLARGGVVCGTSAGASIQASFLVRGHPSDDSTIMMSPGHEMGFGLLSCSAIDQHVNTRRRQRDLDSVVAAHPELLGIGLDEGAAVVVHGDSFFVVGGQVGVHDGKEHNDSSRCVLSSGQAYNLKNRSVAEQPELPLTLTVIGARRRPTPLGYMTVGTARLESHERSESQQISYQCDVNLYGSNGSYSGRPDGPGHIKIRAREINTDELCEYTCKILS